VINLKFDCSLLNRIDHKNYEKLIEQFDFSALLSHSSPIEIVTILIQKVNLIKSSLSYLDQEESFNG
jgi:hypothetical protein